VQEQDRVSRGWQPFLTPRQTLMIYRALKGEDARPEDTEHMPKLVGWFEYEAQARRELTGAQE
jgi:hypothetical protein